MRFRRLRGGVEGTTWLPTARRPDGVRSGVLRLDGRADSETAAPVARPSGPVDVGPMVDPQNNDALLLFVDLVEHSI